MRGSRGLWDHAHCVGVMSNASQFLNVNGSNGINYETGEDKDKDGFGVFLSSGNGNVSTEVRSFSLYLLWPNTSMKHPVFERTAGKHEFKKGELNYRLARRVDNLWSITGCGVIVRRRCLCAMFCFASVRAGVAFGWG